MHLNDSKSALGSGHDRHENIGKGLIGLTAFSCLVNDPRFNNIPLILETPSTTDEIYEQEIDLLYSLIHWLFDTSHIRNHDFILKVVFIITIFQDK